MAKELKGLWQYFWQLCFLTFFYGLWLVQYYLKLKAPIVDCCGEVCLQDEGEEEGEDDGDQGQACQDRQELHTSENQPVSEADETRLLEY